MARTGRLKSELGIYHVILRANDSLFFKNEDYNVFLDTLSKYFDNNTNRLYAYSLEKNKVHMIFYVHDELNLVMKPLCISYARYINRTYNVEGKLFYDRYMSEPINDKEFLTEAINFVNNIPESVNSLKEYRESATYCAVDFLKKEIDINKITNPEIIIPCMNNYSDMTDKEILDYILYINNKKLKDLDKNAKKDIVEISVKKSNLTKARLCRILGLSAASANTIKKPVKAKKEKEEKKEAPKQNNRELSVWLL